MARRRHYYGNPLGVSWPVILAGGAVAFIGVNYMQQRKAEKAAAAAAIVAAAAAQLALSGPGPDVMIAASEGTDYALQQQSAAAMPRFPDPYHGVGYPTSKGWFPPRGLIM